jgi:predicted HTH transcriptional regulator
MPEQQNIEYKSSWHDDYLKWLCGFANAQGGKIYIGKDDDGNTVDIDVSKRTATNDLSELVEQYKMFNLFGASVGTYYEFK